MTDEEPIVNEEPTTTNDEPTVDLWISVDDVIAFHGLKPQHLNINKNDKDADDQLAAIVTNWIIHSQYFFYMYCNRNYTSSTVRPAVQNICLRLTSNMVRLAIQNRDSPIIKVNDWTITTVPSDIFTDDLKEDLRPFIKDSSTEPDSIGILAITGSDD